MLTQIGTTNMYAVHKNGVGLKMRKQAAKKATKMFSKNT